MKHQKLLLLCGVLGILVSAAFLKSSYVIPMLAVLTVLLFITGIKYVYSFSATKYYKIWLAASFIFVIVISIGLFSKMIRPVSAETQTAAAQVVDTAAIAEQSAAAAAAKQPENLQATEQSTKKLKRERLDTPLKDRLISFLGIFILILISWLMSVNRKGIKWRPVIWGIALQIIFGLIVISDTAGAFFFNVVDGAVGQLLAFSEEGAAFVFGKLAYGPVDERGLKQGMFFFFAVLPTIIFFSSLMTLLYHIGVMGYVVKFFAKIMQRTMKTSGAESLSAAANIFVGQTEAPLLVKPFVSRMTVSELHAVMTGGFATVAGGVMAAYVVFLKDFIPNIAGHLVTASIMSAPAALAISKIVYLETEESVIAGDVKIYIEKP
ncbi:MAG TPA: Na+ dependent nucleoside transporter N-terminal domain-containing protein, partial [bacterium]|nr:Na+ dependent nucleoside transporter N-terminal domain-containing protein [bacterium]